jgi:folate-binding protein YgfZ
VPAAVQGDYLDRLPQTADAHDDVGIDEALRITRIEHGIPWPGFEITDEYLPAETRQLARAVSYQKGCYLGQEVVERMRSRQVVARQLTLLKTQSDALPAVGADITTADGKSVGQVTSACFSLKHSSPLALGYVKTASSNHGTTLQVTMDHDRTATAIVIAPPALAH